MRVKFMAPKAVGPDGRILSAGASVDVIHIPNAGSQPSVILENVYLHSCMLFSESTITVWLEVTADEASKLKKLKETGKLEVRLADAEGIRVKPKPLDESGGYPLTDESASPEQGTESAPTEDAPREIVVATDGLRIARIGLGCHFVRLHVCFVAILLTLVLSAAIVGFSAAREADRRVMQGLSIGPVRDETPVVMLAVGLFASGGLQIIQSVLGIIGSALCIRAPRESGARGYIVTSLILDVGAIPVAFVLSFFGYSPGFLAPVGIASWIFFMLFMRGLAQYLNDSGTAEEVGSIIVFMVLHFVLPLMLLILVWTLYAALGVVTGGFWSFLVGATCLYWFVRCVQYFKLMLQLIDTVRSAIGRSNG